MSTVPAPALTGKRAAAVCYAPRRGPPHRAMSHDPPPRCRRIARFWAPLEATWLMMAVEGPFLAAVIARLADPETNLAAYGVAFSLALIAESPIIMIMSASTALVRDYRSLVALRRFTWSLNAAITVVLGVILLPPVFRLLALGLVGLPPAVAARTHAATLLLLPWPAAIGVRRFFQGILIRHDLTRRVAYGTVVRLVAMSATAAVVALRSGLPGASVGAAALAAGVTAEAAASWIMVRGTVARLRRGEVIGAPSQSPLTTSGIVSFYTPLALTSMLTLGVQPLVTFFVGHSRFPVESLAVLPVVVGLLFVFRSPGLAFQEVAIALLGERHEGYRPLRAFAVLLAAVAAGGLSVMAWTPLATVWFHEVSGLSAELTAFAVVPARILSVMPALTVLLSFQRALLVSLRSTSLITGATVVEVAGIVITLAVAITLLDAVGAVAAAAALMIGRLGANTYLALPLRRMLRGEAG